MPHPPHPAGFTPPPTGVRVLVVGTTGSGKTTVARALSQACQLSYICNDAIIWGPNWTEVPREQRPAAFDQATLGDRWVIDGNFVPPRHPEDDLVLARADTVVWLDLPRHVVMRQVTARTLRRIVTREKLWHGNVESLPMALDKDSVVRWAWNTHHRRRDEIARFFADPARAHLRRIRLTSRYRIDAWLAGMRRAPPASKTDPMRGKP